MMCNACIESTLGPGTALGFKPKPGAMICKERMPGNACGGVQLGCDMLDTSCYVPLDMLVGMLLAVNL